jgi:hypothetical protein
MKNPRTGGAGAKSVGRPARQTHDTAATPSDVPAQLSRRRAASYRCPPLPDRRRDPADPVHPIRDHPADHQR